MGDFLTFRRMVTPILIQVVYWIVTVVVIAAALWCWWRHQGEQKGRWGWLS